MDTRRSRTVVWLLLLAVLGGATIWSATQGLLSTSLIREHDSERIEEYRILGLIPFSRTVRSSKIKVSDDFWREFQSFGIKLSPEMVVAVNDMRPMRVIKNRSVSYQGNGKIKGDHRALVSYVAKQLGSPPPYLPAWQFTIAEKANAAKTLSMHLALGRTRSAPGQDDVYIGLHLALPQ